MKTLKVRADIALKPNKDIREYACLKGVYMWQIAEYFNYTPSWFTSKLRKELPENDKNRLKNIIDELAKQ